MNVNIIPDFKNEDLKLNEEILIEVSKELADDSLNVAEIFRSSTRENVTGQKVSQENLTDSEICFTRHRIFLNHVDQFNGKYIARYLCKRELEDILTQDKEDVTPEEGEKEHIDSKDNVKNAADYKDPPPEDFDVGVSEKTSIENKPKSTSTVLNKHRFEIIGTVKDSNCEIPEGVSEIVQYSEDDELFFLKILTCGFIIYDITRDPQQISEATWVLQAIEYYLDRLNENNPKASKMFKEFRMFILISSMMTWAMTQPILPEEPDMPFIEDDYKKRKPHPNYNEHIKLERKVTAVGRKHKDQFKTLVVTTGIPYGEEEDILHFLFRMAWQNEPYLPVSNPGTNLVPLIHVADLAHILYGILKDFPLRSKFVLAMEPYVLTLYEIVKSIASEMGTGRVKAITKEETMLYNELKQDVFDLLNINFNAEPLYISEHMEVKWRHEHPFSENMKQIVQEFRDARKFKPLIIFVHGPPAIGKTKLSKRLCEHYKLHYLEVDMVVHEVIQHMRDHVERRIVKENQQRERDENGEEEEEDDEKLEVMEGAVDLLQEIEENLERNQGKLDDEYKIKFLRERMLSNSCQNQGYVLDGYPTTPEEAKLLFDAGPEDEELMEEDYEYQEILYNKTIIPEYIINLKASDDYLIEKFIENTIKCVEEKMDEEFLHKLEEFRRINPDIYNYFYGFDINDFTSVDKDQNTFLEKTFKEIVKMIGKPRNYVPSHEESLKIAKQKEKARKIEEKLQREKIDAEYTKKKRERLEERENYARLLNTKKESEEELLAKKAIPIRHYLIKYIIPVLTKGIIAVAELKPEDPIDYLAEYIFKHNPDGKMHESMNLEYSYGNDEIDLNVSHSSLQISNVGKLVRGMLDDFVTALPDSPSDEKAMNDKRRHGNFSKK